MEGYSRTPRYLYPMEPNKIIITDITMASTGLLMLMDEIFIY